MWTEMHKIFAHIRSDGDVRAVILSAEGKSFTAGLDLTDPVLTDLYNEKSDSARIAIALRELIDRFQQAITSIEQCERPVIGVSHGYAIGLAIDILSTTDIRYAAKDCKFSIREAAIGLAADIGTLQRFPKIIGNDSTVRELALTARFFDAEEALQIGFVSKVLDSRQSALDAALATANEIAAHSPVAITGTKQALVYSRDHSVAEGLRFMQYLNAGFLQTDDMAAAVAAAMSKQKAEYAKL